MEFLEDELVSWNSSEKNQEGLDELLKASNNHTTLIPNSTSPPN